MVINNANLLQMCNDCGAVGFVPVLTYAYDAGAAEITVEDGSTFPSGDGIDIIKVRVHDFDGKEVRGTITTAGEDVVLDVSALNRSKPLAITATILTDNQIAADGGAYGYLQAAGNIGFFDVNKMAKA